MASCPRLRPTTLLQAGHSSLPQRPLQAELFYFAATALRRRNCSTLRQRKLASDAAPLRQRPLQAGHSTRRHDSTAVIPDFRPRLANRCSQKVKTRAILASILDFRPRLANRCSQKAKTGANRASILDFRPRLANRCSQKVKTGAIRASILDFMPKLANRCSKEIKTGAIRAAHLQHAFHHALTMRLALDV